MTNLHRAFYFILPDFKGSMDEPPLKLFSVHTECDLFVLRAITSDSFCKTASGDNGKWSHLVDPDITAMSLSKVCLQEANMCQ